MLKNAFYLKPSRFYLAAWAGLALLSFTAALSLYTSVFIKLACCLFVGIYSFFIIYRYILLRHNQSILELHYHKKATWLIQMKKGKVVGKLLGSSTVTRIISILRFKIQGQRFPISCIILRDSLKSGKYQQMMMCAKLG